MMPVDMNQWRATIGCFHLSIQNLSPLRKTVKPFSTLFQICKLYWFCCCFTAISVLVLPLTLMMQFLAVHFVLQNIYSNFIPNEIKTIRPRQAPWITESVKNFLRNKNSDYKNFVRSGRLVPKYSFGLKESKI